MTLEEFIEYINSKLYPYSLRENGRAIFKNQLQDEEVPSFTNDNVQIENNEDEKEEPEMVAENIENYSSQEQTN